MLNIDGTVTDTGEDFGPPILRLGFRPFFLGAGLFAIVSMLVWMANQVFSVELPVSALPPSLWHAHEMIFGYTLAVLAGFLLTAIKNWTGLEVLRGRALASLFIIWLAARLSIFFAGDFPIVVIAVIDCGFMFLLTIVCLLPVIKVRQYKQVGIISKLFLLMLSNVVFYLGITGLLDDGVHWGMYSAIYMIIALMLVMMRRVMPMFIKNGIDIEIEIVNRRWLDISSLVLLLCLWLLDVFTDYGLATSVTAAILALLHTVRLAGWYSHAIWHKPLVWILVVAYAAIIFGFTLKAAEYFLGVSRFLSLHAFTVGGIGLVTIGMMSRVALGHTGRSVFEPPATVFWALLAAVSAAVVRVILPLFDMTYYHYWVGLSQLLWITAFAIFVWLYAPMLLSARVDGKDG